MPDPRPTLESVKEQAFRRLRRPLALTRAGMVLERLARAFWPFATVAMATLSAAMLNAHRIEAPQWAVWGVAGAVSLALIATLLLGMFRLRFPTRGEALDRLDRSVTGRPITALSDIQAIGGQDKSSRAVWRVHVERMAERVAGVRPARPDLRVSSRDRLGLRLMAATLFIVALVFGSIWRVGGVRDAIVDGPGATLAGGPAWEGWAEPPAYTYLPALYLIDQPEGELTLPEGTRITIRLYGEVGALEVRETVSGLEAADASAPAQEFTVSRQGSLEIGGRGGRAWTINVTPDTTPEIEATGALEWAADGALRQPYAASDDYGIEAALARITLDLGAVDRRYGLSPEPENREAITMALPLPISGDRRDFEETLTENLSEHPWARLPVIVQLSAEDARGQTGQSEPLQAILPGRRFFDPLAKAVIETRRDILWTRDNGPRAAQLLRTVSHRPDGFMRDASVYLKLREAIRDLEGALADDRFDAERRDELAAILWELALEIEFGNLADARARLERAQDRLSEAIENGASDEEIAALIEELRRAMQDYLRQLAQQQGQEGENQQAQNQQMQQMTGQDLQDMLDRLQELMEQGRMAEAAELLEQLRQMMENMQVTQGQQGQGQSPGQQAMEGLAETLREQQGLSDEAFRDLQEQFNQGANQGQSQGNTGRDGGLGRGEQHQPGQGQGQGQQGNQQGQPGARGNDDGGTGSGDDLGRSLADRQQALRQELNRQRGALPGAGTPEGDAAREALGRAGDAMDRAEDDLRTDDLAGALDNQAEAIEALRDGMRALGEAMAQQQQGQGQQTGDANPDGTRRDPLGRSEGNRGQVGTDENLLQGEDVYRRARELLDEIRKRQGDRTRPSEELEYLKRLLDRF